MKVIKTLIILFVLLILSSCTNSSTISKQEIISAEENAYPEGVKDGTVSTKFYEPFKKWHSIYKETSTTFDKSLREVLFIHRSTTDEQAQTFSDELNYILIYKQKWDQVSNDLLWSTNTPADEAILNATQNIEYSFENYMNAVLVFMENKGESKNLDAATTKYGIDNNQLEKLLSDYKIYE